MLFGPGEFNRSVFCCCCKDQRPIYSVQTQTVNIRGESPPQLSPVHLTIPPPPPPAPPPPPSFRFSLRLAHRFLFLKQVPVVSFGCHCYQRMSTMCLCCCPLLVTVKRTIILKSLFVNSATLGYLGSQRIKGSWIARGVVYMRSSQTCSDLLYEHSLQLKGCNRSS